MAWLPISGTVPQYEVSGVAAVGHYLKFYKSGTTTPTNMATDSTGGTTLAKAILDANGFPLNGSSAVFIPHIDRDYKLALYVNATDADANTLGNAVWVIDAMAVSGDRSFTTVAAMVAATDLNVGDFITVEEYATNSKSGVLFFKVVAAATGTADGGRFIDLDTHQAQANFPASPNIGMWGCIADWGGTSGTNNATDFQAAVTYTSNNGLQLTIPIGRYGVTGTITTANTTTLNLKGFSSLVPSTSLSSGTPPASSELIFTGVASATDVFFDCGNQANIKWDGVTFSSADTTGTSSEAGEDWGLLELSSAGELTGSIDPAASTAVVGVNTLFTTELAVGYTITVTGETRTVDSITDNTNLVVTAAFSNNANDTSPKFSSGTSEQSSGAGNYTIANCNFQHWGGTALSLFGETFGIIQNNRFDQCAQYLDIDSFGETIIEGNKFANVITGADSFATDHDVGIYIRNSNPKFKNNQYVDSKGIRGMMHLYDCRMFEFSGEVWERPGLATLSDDMILITDDISTLTFFGSFEDCLFISSSVTGTLTKAMVKTAGSSRRHGLAIKNCSFQFGSGVDARTPLCDFTTNAPQRLELGSNYRLPDQAYFVQYADGAKQGSNLVVLDGLSVDNIEYRTVTLPNFTIAQNQTKTDAGTSNLNLIWEVAGSGTEAAIRIPVQIEVSADQSIGASGQTTTFYFKASYDSLANWNDPLVIAGTGRVGSLVYPLRNDYMTDRASATLGQFQAANDARIVYDSSASVDTSTIYSIRFTYAVIRDTGVGGGDTVGLLGVAAP